MQSNLSELILCAHRHIVMAHVLERLDSDAAFEREMLAWDDAYKVGQCSDRASPMPILFSQSRTLTFAWEKARADRVAEVGC